LLPWGEVAVTYLIVPRVDRCRLLVKLLLRYPGGRLSRSLWWPLRPLAPWGELVMMRKQLLTLKQLAEEQAVEAEI
jgi:hypothetical protein